MTRNYARTVRTVLLVVFVVLVAGLTVPASGPAVAQTTVGGVTFVDSDIATDTTWSPENGPYRITQDVTVTRNATLTLAPGTEVQLAEDVTVTVEGSLVADGTEARTVRVRMTPGAPNGIRWDSLRYAGGRTSELTLRNASVSGGTNAITVASDGGRVSVVDTVLRDHAESALRVGTVRRTPAITVRRATVRDIGGHALRVAPGFGAVGAVRVNATPATRANRSVHTLRFVPGAPVTTDEIRIDYGEHGTLTNATLRDIGIDTDDDPKIDRSLEALVSNVDPGPDGLGIGLDRGVDIAGDSRLVVRYEDVGNPETRGVYPVSLRLAHGGVSQLATPAVAALNVGGVTERYVDVRPQRPTRIPSLTVASSSFAGIDGSAVFLAADRVDDVTVSENRISSAAGDGVSVRARRLEAALRSNRISVSDAGVSIAHRSSATLVVSGNRITDSETGVRIRQSGLRSPADLELTLDGNTLSGSERYGVAVDGRSATLTRFRIVGNTVTGNGRGGVALDPETARHGTVADNRIANNGGDGLRFDGRSLRNARVVDNRIEDNAGHGLLVRTALAVHRTDIADNRFANNAGAGVMVSSPVTHGGRLNVTNNTVAANGYGVVVEGALRATIAHNDVVFNTNNRTASPPVVRPFDATEPAASDTAVRPGTGVWVGEGEAGVVLHRGSLTEPLSDLVANPRLSAPVLDNDNVVILRTHRASAVYNTYPGALSAWQVSGGIPTGLALSPNGTDRPGVDLRENDIYGQRRGLTVDIEALVDGNTTARVVVDQLRTVDAERNYWGAPSGPYHASILPAGDGDAVVTERGWVDFVPFANDTFGERYARPVPRLDVPASAVPNRSVTASGAASTATRFPVASYDFAVGSREFPPQSSPRLSFSMPNRSVTVRLAVEDGLGIDSAGTANATVAAALPASGSGAPSTATNATTPSNTTAGTTPASPPTDTGGFPLFGALLGAVPTLAGVGLGVYGILVSLRGRNPSVSISAVQGLVALGVSLWVVAGLLTDPLLVRVGVGAGAVWAVLSAGGYLLLRS